MVLQQLQRLLEGIYDVPSTHVVDEFVFTDRALLPADLRHRAADEQVLVSEQDDGAAIGVYLDEKLLERLAAANPVDALHGGNLADFWTALEGVSHFTYLAWNTSHDRPVSLLELELQAEVDKYVSSLWLLRTQQPARFPRELHHLLFERARVHLAARRQAHADAMQAERSAAARSDSDRVAADAARRRAGRARVVARVAGKPRIRVVLAATTARRFHFPHQPGDVVVRTSPIASPRSQRRACGQGVAAVADFGEAETRYAVR